MCGVLFESTSAQPAEHAVHKKERKACQEPKDGPGRLSQKVEKKIDTQKAPPPPPGLELGTSRSRAYDRCAASHSLTSRTGGGGGGWTPLPKTYHQWEKVRGFFLGWPKLSGANLVLFLRNERKFWYEAPCCCFLVDVHGGFWVVSAIF